MGGIGRNRLGRDVLPIVSPSFTKAARARSYAPLPQRGRGAGGEGEKACAPRTQRTQAMYPYQLCPPLPRGRRGGAAGRTAVRPYTPLPPCGRGAGGEGLKQVSPPSRLAGVWCAVVEAGQSGASRRPAPAARARGRAIRGTR